MDESSLKLKRPHLTKEQRLPKCYKEVEKIIRSVKSCEQNYKTILANSRLRGSAFKKVYRMTVNVLKNYNYIQKIIDKIQLLEKEKYLRREITSVLIYEILFGYGSLPGESKVVTIIQQHENDIRWAHEGLQNDHDNFMPADLNIPRYVRVHTLVTTVPYVIKDLEREGFKQIFYEKDLSEEKYLELVCSLESGTFLIDFHFEDILVFEHSENLTFLDLYKNGHIFLQDKASYIPVHVLNPHPSCSVLDACAAPGMKTLHIASKMKNKGILIACERDKSRFESLKEMMTHGSVKICKELCKDFKLVDPSDQAYSNVEYILIDPSCSGSGMVNRMDEVTDTEDSKKKERLMKLAGFQIILLKHALKFPLVKRVVYSTCSIHEEENEYVVHEALNACNGAFKLVPVMPEWSHRGSENYEFGKMCLRTVPHKHLTNGFFVAMFERVDCAENINRAFSKNYREHKVHVTGFETSHYDKIGTSSERQKLKLSKLKKEYKKEVIKTPESFDDFSLNRHENYSKKEKEHCNDNQQVLYHEENYISQPQQVRCRTDTSICMGGDVKGHESFSQNVIYEQEEENSAYKKKGKKKHKKKKKEKNSTQCLHEPDDLRRHMPNVSLQKCSELKENDFLFPDMAGNNNDDYSQKKKSKKSKHQSRENAFEKEIIDKLTDMTSSHKKKKKHVEMDNQLTEVLSFQSEIDVDPQVTKLEIKKEFNCEDVHSNSLNFASSKITQFVNSENSFQNESSTEIPPKRKKKHKHSKSSDIYSNDCSNTCLSESEIKPSNHLHEKDYQYANNMLQMQQNIPVNTFSAEEEISGNKSKKHKKRKHNDKSAYGYETVNCSFAEEQSNVTEGKVLSDSEKTAALSNNFETVGKSKKCKSKKHTIEKSNDF